MRSFVRIKSWPNEEITLVFTDIGKSCPKREQLTLQICILTLFEKIKFSRKFPIYSIKLLLEVCLKVFSTMPI